MTLPLSIPSKGVSVWPAETSPRYARAWIAALPLSNSGEAARELYQALFTLNRLEFDVRDRFEILDLYRGPIATVCAGLETHLKNAVLPMAPSKRQLAEFIRRLHMEMAYGYKCCLHQMDAKRLLRRKGDLRTRVIARALHYLCEVLARSYGMYLPYPPGVWREIHELYRMAATARKDLEATDVIPDEAPGMTIRNRYQCALLLGLVNPYQLPQDAVWHIKVFLEHWGAKASLTNYTNTSNPAGRFLVDLTADSPPMPFPREGESHARTGVLVLDAVGLVRTVHVFARRIERGESALMLGLGSDCLDATWLDLLKRMIRAWGLIARRRDVRIKRNHFVYVCSGVSALHFFSNGQKPFSVPAAAEPPGSLEDREPLPPGVIRMVAKTASGGGPAGKGTSRARAATDNYRVDRWQVKDVGPRGMFLVRDSGKGNGVRIGDLLGVQQADDPRRWRVAMVRWLKNPELNQIEMGIEILAPIATPVAVKAIPAADTVRYAPGLLLPGAPGVQRPETLIAGRGIYRAGRDMYVLENGQTVRQLRALKLLERAGSFEQMLFSEIFED